MLEVWGASNFLTLYSFLNEDHGNVYVKSRAAVKDTKLQILLRGQNGGARKRTKTRCA